MVKGIQFLIFKGGKKLIWERKTVTGTIRLIKLRPMNRNQVSMSSVAATAYPSTSCQDNCPSRVAHNESCSTSMILRGREYFRIVL